MNYARVMAVSSIVTALTCMFLSYLLFDSIRNERKLYDDRMTALVDSVTPHLDACAAKDAELLKRLGRQNWKVRK